MKNIQSDLQATDFDDGDSTVYQWEIVSKRRVESTLFTLGYIAFFVVGPFLIMYYFAHDEQPAPNNPKVVPAEASYVIGWFLAGLGSFILIVLNSALGITWLKEKFGKSNKQPRNQSSGVNRNQRSSQYSSLMGISVLYVLVGSFGLLNSPYSAFAQGFVGNEDATSAQWCLYYVDNIAGVVLMDVPDVFETRVSSIRVDDAASRCITVAIRLLIAWGIINFFLGFRSNFRRRVFFGTVRECRETCDNTIFRNRLTLRCTAKLTPIDEKSISVEVFTGLRKKE